MTDADRAKMRETNGCGQQPMYGEHGVLHVLAMPWAISCDPCLDLLMQAARAGALAELENECTRAWKRGVEECAKIAEPKRTDEDSCCARMAEDIADSIRALLNPSSPPAAEGARECDCQDKLPFKVKGAHFGGCPNAPPTAKREGVE